MPGMDELDRVEAKQAWRVEVRRARRERAQRGGRAEAGTALADAVLALVWQLSAGAVCRVTAYESRPTEPPTEALVDALRAAGHAVLLPITGADRTLEWDDSGRRRPPESIGSASLVLTPGLAVDRAGRRLGQGGGYYDAALAHVPAGVPVVTLLWDDELVEGPLPTQDHDRRVDGVLMPTAGVVWLGRPRPEWTGPAR